MYLNDPDSLPEKDDKKGLERHAINNLVELGIYQAMTDDSWDDSVAPMGEFVELCIEPLPDNPGQIQVPSEGTDV